MFNSLITLSAGLICLASSANYKAPANDSFYSPELSTYENSKPGDILDHREVDIPQSIRGVSNIYQILYRTENANGTAQATVTTLLVPENADKSKVISYQVPEDAAYLSCAPSYSFLTSSSSDPTLQAMVQMGYYVNMPDYEGPTSAFGAGIQAGRATLDSLRAVAASGSFSGVDKDAKLAMSGYSGGSIATGWAAELQQEYAKDVNLVGAAVGGFVVNLTAVLEYIDGTIASGYIPAAMVGIASQYLDFKQLIYNDVKPENRSALEYVSTHCSTEDLTEFALKDVFDYLTSGSAIMNNPIVKEVLGNNTMGKKAPKIPLFVYEGGEDQIVPIKAVDSTIAEYCKNGATIEYYVEPENDHLSEGSNGLPYALEWLSSRLDGKSVASGCRSSTTSLPVKSLPTGKNSLNSTSNSTSSVSANSNVTKISTSSSPSRTVSSGVTASGGASQSAGSSSGPSASSSASDSSSTSSATSLVANSAKISVLYILGLFVFFL